MIITGVYTKIITTIKDRVGTWRFNLNGIRNFTTFITRVFGININSLCVLRDCRNIRVEEYGWRPTETIHA